MSGHKILRLMISLNCVKNYTDDCVTVDGVQLNAYLNILDVFSENIT